MEKKELTRKKLNNHPTCSFNEIFEFIKNLPDKRTTILNTTGNPRVKFTTEARANKRDGRLCLVSTSGVRDQSKIYVYAEDWGYKQGMNGVRITHYVEPLYKWFSEVD